MCHNHNSIAEPLTLQWTPQVYSVPAAALKYYTKDATTKEFTVEAPGSIEEDTDLMLKLNGNNPATSEGDCVVSAIAVLDAPVLTEPKTTSTNLFGLVCSASGTACPSSIEVADAFKSSSSFYFIRGTNDNQGRARVKVTWTCTGGGGSAFTVDQEATARISVSGTAERGCPYV